MNELASYLIWLFPALFCSAFIRFFTTLTIFRYALGLKQAGFGVVIFGLSLILSFVAVESHTNIKENFGGVAKTAGASQAGNSNYEEKYKPFIEKYSDKNVTNKLLSIRSKYNKEQNTLNEPTFNLLLASFMISELKSAFILGLMVIIPFVVIDLIIANVLLAAGINQIPYETIALPIKLLLFISVNGWELIMGKLLGSYL